MARAVVVVLTLALVVVGLICKVSAYLTIYNTYNGTIATDFDGTFPLYGGDQTWIVEPLPTLSNSDWFTITIQRLELMMNDMLSMTVHYASGNFQTVHFDTNSPRKFSHVTPTGGDSILYILFKLSTLHTTRYRGSGLSITWQICPSPACNCSDGYFYKYGWETCLQCPTGRASTNSSRYSNHQYDTIPIYRYDGYIDPLDGTSGPVGAISEYECQPCPPGTFEMNGHCTPCSPGSYQPSVGATRCYPCPFTSNVSGARSCRPCDSGYVQIDGMCQPCPAGTYAPQSGMPSCLPCPYGSVSINNGSSQCTLCPEGTEWVSTTVCRPCPVGFYRSATSTTGYCRRCDLYYVTTMPGATSCSPVLFTDYWHDSGHSFHCPYGYQTAMLSSVLCQVPPGYDDNAAKNDSDSRYATAISAVIFSGMTFILALALFVNYACRSSFVVRKYLAQRRQIPALHRHLLELSSVVAASGTIPNIQLYDLSFPPKATTRTSADTVKTLEYNESDDEGRVGSIK